MRAARTSFIVKRLGHNLAAARRARGLRQADIADRMQIEVSQYARMERGEVASGIVRYLDAFWALHMAPEEFFHQLEERIP